MSAEFTIEARPTEYRGVRMRSKSEAIFARALELDGWIWEYEPPGYDVNGWVPDFRIVRWLQKGAETGTPIVLSALIEYKPMPVTSSYREELRERFDNLRNRTIREFFILAVANPFDQETPRFAVNFMQGKEGGATLLERSFRRFEEAKTYRFDLS